MRLLCTLLGILCCGAAAMAVDQPRVGRRELLQRSLAVTATGCLGSASGLVAAQIRRLCSNNGLVDPDWQDPLAAVLRSSTGTSARLERAQLELQWKSLRQAHANGDLDHPRLEEAFDVMLRVRAALGEAERLAKAQRLGEIDTVITGPLIADLEQAATLLASSSMLSADARAGIGWQWGACGWRRCGAQADAAQAMWKLRSNLGMVVPLEALFYLDVAKRAVDEILQLGVSEGFVAAASVPLSEYLDEDTLGLFLASEGDSQGDVQDPEESVREWEEEVLRAAGLFEDDPGLDSDTAPPSVD
jgi:hypothetical protein